MQNDSASFYWYDLETSGTVSQWDRIVQFAGIRTDHELNEIGDSYSTYVRLPDDVLPNPESVLVTGITPQLTHSEGIGEWQAITRINELFSTPQTCVVGYNSLRFDDEFMRYGLYRMLLDPYAREWQNGNSRWDIIDLVRATGALRREGINWPTDEEANPCTSSEILALSARNRITSRGISSFVNGPRWKILASQRDASRTVNGLATSLTHCSLVLVSLEYTFVNVVVRSLSPRKTGMCSFSNSLKRKVS